MLSDLLELLSPTSTNERQEVDVRKRSGDRHKHRSGDRHASRIAAKGQKLIRKMGLDEKTELPEGDGVT